MMKKRSKILAALLVVTVLFGGVLPVKAASSEVTIEVKQSNVNVAVTVPSQVPIVFNEDGTNTYPQNWEIENNGISGVRVSRIDAKANGSGWTLAETGTKISELPANTKTIQFYIGEATHKSMLYPEEGAVDDSATSLFNESTMNIPSGSSLNVEFEMIRGAFTEGADMTKAFDLEFTFEFM